MIQRNWAGNVAYRAAVVHEPKGLDELAEIITGAEKVRVLGSRHSFNDIADTDGALVSLAKLPAEIDIDADAGIASVPAGLRHGDLVPAFERAGVALANLASLPHISVGGAVQTGTHGSGDRIGALGTQVAALELLTASGAVQTLRRGDEGFDGAVVGLGALGVVTRLHVDVEPAYRIAQTVFEDARWDDVLARFDEVTGAGDSVSLFTTWRHADLVDQVWVKSRPGRARHDVLHAAGARVADGPRHPLPGIEATPCTAQGGLPGPWFDRLPHFRLAFIPSSGEELQSEYLVDRADLPDAVDALRALAPVVAPLLQVCEVRTMAADALWLSPAFGRDTVGLHFMWLPDEAGVRALLPRIEAAMPASARPHWGKVFELTGAELAGRYPRWTDFVALRARLDPSRRFANRFIDALDL